MSKLRCIQVPSAIVLTDRVTGQQGQVLGFFDWACVQWLNDQRWHTNMPRLIAIVSRLELARGNHPTLSITLVEEDWRILCDVVKQPVPAPPNNLQPPLIAMQMEAYKMAVLDAKEDA